MAIIERVASREGWPSFKRGPFHCIALQRKHNRIFSSYTNLNFASYLITGLLPNFRHSNYRTIITPCEISNAILHALLTLMLRYLHFVQ